MTPTHTICLTAASWLTAGLLWLACGHQALAAPGASPAQTAGAGSTPQWHQLTPAQQKVLTPLAQQWHTLDEASQAKWLRVANRFESMSPDKQARMQARMHHWAQLSPQQRAEARLRFQQTRQLGADERQRKWAEYQALSTEDREDLTRQAVRKAQPVFLPNSAVGPREARQAYTAKRQARADASAQKSNMVPNAAPGSVSNRTVVRPGMVNTGTGATTNLVNQRPTPSFHQQTGLPKIAATQGFVDPVTMLPRKGAQGAAMAPTPQELQRHGRY